MNMNIYSTLTLLQAINLIMPVNTFLKSTFFGVDETFVTATVLVDYKKGRRKLAPFVAPRSKGVSIDREGFRTDTYAPPKMAPQRPITIDDIMIRGMGESIMSQRTPADRQAELLGRDLAEFTAMMERREEWMIAQVMCGGKVTLQGYSDSLNKNVEISTLDYSFTNTDGLTGEAKWGTGTASIYKNIHDWRLAVIKASGVAPKYVILGDDAYVAFINDADIQKKMQMFTGQIVKSEPSVKNEALTYVATIPGLGLEVYTYSEWYVDEEDGLEYPMIPTNGVLMSSPNIGSMRYGAVTQMENGQFVSIEGKRIPKSWADEDAEVRMLRVSSRPVPVPIDVSRWFYATVK